MFEAGLAGDEVEGLCEAGDRAFALLVKAAGALGGKLPDGSPAPAELMAAHIWALSHGMASLFAIQKAGLQKPGVFEASQLFSSGLSIYLKGLGIDITP
jgi:hypothetical protein